MNEESLKCSGNIYVPTTSGRLHLQRKFVRYDGKELSGHSGPTETWIEGVDALPGRINAQTLEDIMTFTRDCFAFLTYTAIIMAFHCEADRPPPPKGLTYKWLDAFTVNVSWKQPSGLPDGSEVRYKYCQIVDGKPDCQACTTSRNFTVTCLTEKMGSDCWTYNISTVGSQSCDSLNESTPVSITIRSRPRAQVVEDFKCFIYPEKMNCSWIPVNQSLDLTLSYRVCGLYEQRVKGLKVCDQPYSSGKRNGCSLKAAVHDDICILVETKAGMSTFRPVLVVPSPEVNISKEGNNLKLIWTRPEIGHGCTWIYEVSYSKCNEPKVLLNLTVNMGEPTMQVAYDKCCLYEFQSRVRTEYPTCKNIFSDFGEVATYGKNEPPDRTLTVVAIVIPIILFVCVILSCYCFRRHSAIICPIIPDPSAIFKEMIMNGNKEHKNTPGNLYTPVPEPIEPCKITLVTENTVLQQNS
ncbi:interleukin-13 receptor subunit alpha-1-like [Enoplosus armatus]|uniref:interleukin-13 receptor subunit alpha-1-like n=1 Tax=Enoplosus armatus TaxID=215367 RepID=UPI003993BFCC